MNKNTKKFVKLRQSKESIELIKYRSIIKHNNTLLTEDETINSDD